MHTRAWFGLLIAMVMLLDGCGGRPAPGESPPTGACTPAAEVCDGVDNDCNGVVDDEVAAAADCQGRSGSLFVCVNGTCQCRAALCGGTCTDTSTDVFNCGTCGHLCPLPSGPHTAAACAGGLCTLRCTDGYVLAGGLCVPSDVDPGTWSYPEHQFVIDTLVLPENSTSAKEFGFDLDGNGTPDNQYGNIMAALGSAMDPPTAQDQTNAAMARGDLIHLFALYAQSPSTSSTATLWELLGEPLPLTNGPQPGQTFTVAANAPQDLMCAGAIMAGAGAFGGAQARLMLHAPLIMTASLTLVPLEAARAAFDVSSDGAMLENGRLGGLIPEDFVETELVPGLALSLDVQVAARCTLENGYCTCEAGSGAETLQSMFDTNDDCHVDVEEVRSNSLIQTFFKLDIQLPDGRRGMSLAVGFHAVRAAFVHEAPAQP